MKSFMLLVALLASPALGFSMQETMSSSLTFDVQAAKNRPVSKVLTLLKDMLKQLEKEAEEADSRVHASVNFFPRMSAGNVVSTCHL